MIKAIIFDKDGILLDSEGLHFRTQRDTLVPYGIRLSALDYGRYGSGVAMDDFYRKMARLNRVKIDVEAVSKFKLELFRQRFHREVKLRAGIRSVLEKAKGGFLLAVASNTRSDFLSEQLRHYRLDRYFSHIVGGGKDIRRKPYPDLYIKTVKLLGVKPGEAVAVEDTESGVVAAKRAGLKCIAVPHRYSRSQDFSRADLVLPRLSMLTIKKIEQL